MAHIRLTFVKKKHIENLQIQKKAIPLQRI